MKRWLFLILLAAGPGRVPAADGVDYLRDIKPLLADKCGACHGPLKQEAGLRLDAGALILKGGESGPVIERGKAAGSLLIKKISADNADERMPPPGEGEPLNPQQLALISAWINSGAAFPEEESITDDPRKHWAYRPPVRPELPVPSDPDWSHPIDVWMAREHQRLGLVAVEPADKYTLLRRLYLDLVGLPPTRQQLRAFVQDDSPDAWGRVVDSLLDSPRYGERWGRHWMDVWRYSDWDGYKQELRGSQRHIWRWRDWIIESLNADKGYDRMIVEMLAGDEIAPDDNSVLAATGFLARNYHNSNRNIWLDATVEHTAKAFLGMTLNCARCHDHKFDPLPQSAYFQFRAIFEPYQVRTDQLPGQPNVMLDGVPRVFDADLAASTYLFQRGDDKRPDKDHPLSPATPAILGGKFDVQPIALPVEAYFPLIKDFVGEDQLAAARKQLADAEKKLADSQVAIADSAAATHPESAFREREVEVSKLQLASLEARLAADRAKYVVGQEKDEQRLAELARAAAVAERELNVRDAELTVAKKQSALDSAKSKSDKEEKKKPTAAAAAAAEKELAAAEKNLKAAQEAVTKTDGSYTPVGKEYPHTSSGRRLALARWIAARDNPLAARVAVNHIWLRHFGAPLVDDMFDFGLRASRPRHVELLDWLAVELVERQWSMKHLHRLIVTSRTWRLASSSGSIESPNLAQDRDNHYLWRTNVRRLDAEIIRDCMLAASGQLETTLGGADIDFAMGETSLRRSIYLRHAYEKQMTMLVVFDAASPIECYRRSESIVPQQALALTNSSMSLNQSRLLASRLWDRVSKKDQDPKRRFVQAAFRQVLSRPPSVAESAACLSFLADQAAMLADPSKLTTFAGGAPAQVKPSSDPQQRALENLVHALMNHNDFVTLR